MSSVHVSARCGSGSRWVNASVAIRPFLAVSSVRTIVRPASSTQVRLQVERSSLVRAASTAINGAPTTTPSAYALITCPATGTLIRSDHLSVGNLPQLGRLLEPARVGRRVEHPMSTPTGRSHLDAERPDRVGPSRTATASAGGTATRYPSPRSAFDAHPVGSQVGLPGAALGHTISINW